MWRGRRGCWLPPSFGETFVSRAQAAAASARDSEGADHGAARNEAEEAERIASLEAARPKEQLLGGLK